VNILQEFQSVVEQPYGYAKKLKERTGKKIVGFFCTYAPEEIIHAAGAHPMRLFGVSENIHLADAHLQAYSCSLVRGALEEALNGNLDFLDGTVFPHTCDSIQRLSDVWRLNTKFAFFSDVIMPVKLDTDSAREYMRSVIRNFKTDIGKWLGAEVSDEKLGATIALYNSIRAKLAEIYRMKSDNPAIATGSEMYGIVKGSMMMDRDALPGMLDSAIAFLKSRGGSKPSGKRLILAGSVCNHPAIYSVVEKSGGAVVWDDLCTGSRYFEGEIAEGGDPCDAIADRYSTRAICPAKHLSNTARGERLAALAKEHGAAGVIFLYLKFCDPHSWDYPYLKGFLDRDGVPSALVEIEEKMPSEGQLATRFEAFIEML